jgi:methyl-accepting chemotaxis protein
MRLIPIISLKWKIFDGCLLLVGAVLAFNFAYAQRQLTRNAHGSAVELQGVYRRYQSFQKSYAQGMGAAVDAWASSPRLRDAFAKADDEAARPLLAGVEQALSQTLHPDFVLFVDRHGDVTRSTGCPIEPGEARSMRLFADLRGGMSIDNVTFEIKHRAWLISAEPVMEKSEVVGAVMIGMRLERLFTEFKSQSDDDPKKQVELALVHNQETISSAAHADDWDDIARATRPESREVIDEGGERVSVLTLPDGRHDYFAAQVNGYDGAGLGSVGQLFILRNRVAREAKLHELLVDNVVVGLVALLAAAFAAFCMSWLVTRPIQQFIAATEDLAHGQGDLTRRIEVKSTAIEMRALGDNLNALFGNLQKLVGEVQGASLQVGASSAEISAASKQMLSGARDQATKIESSTAAVTELSASIQTVAENAMKATSVAKESGGKLQGGMQRLAHTRALVEETAQKIHELGLSGKRIGNIVEVIRQIAEQTSLLALNASIEAAHAGEQGRGFAVVADEVSSLARRVGQSAKDIEGLIQAITDQTQEAVRSMGNVTTEFEAQTSSATSMQGDLTRIIDMVQDTARSVQEQAVVSDEIARNMDAVQKIAQEVLGSSEEAVVQGEALHALALKLEQLVHNFRLEREALETARAAAHPALPERAAERRRVARS